MDEEQGNEIDLGDQDEALMTSALQGQSQQSPVQYPTIMMHGGPELQRIADEGRHVIHGRVIARHLPHGHHKKHRVEMEIRKIKPQRKRGRHKKSHHESDSEHIRKEMEQVGE